MIHIVVMCMEPESKLIGIRVMQKRKSCGFSQEELAERIGYSKNHLSSIERGKQLPTTQFNFQICNILGETPDYYLIGKVTSEVDEITSLFGQMSSHAQNLALKFIKDYLADFKCSSSS